MCRLAFCVIPASGERINGRARARPRLRGTITGFQTLRSWSHALLRFLTICSLALGLACSEREALTPKTVMRDSAGITIVENPSQDIADTTAWAIDTANAVSIGELDGDDMYVFGQIVGVT